MIWRFLLLKFETPYVETLTNSMKKLTLTEVSNPQFKEKYGSLILKLNPKKKLALLYNVIFMARRAVMALIIVFFANMAWAQTILVVLKTALVLYYVGFVWPFDRRSNNRLELANELCILLNMYFLIVYCDFVSSSEARYTMLLMIYYFQAIKFGKSE